MIFSTSQPTGLLALSCAWAAAFVTGAAQAEPCVPVEIQNVRPGQGTLMVAAYADATSFNKAPISALLLRPTAETMTFMVCNLAGLASAAVMVYQDLNGNGKLDENVLGIPTEPWGASGKPSSRSAPTWETAAVPLDGMTIVVKLSK